MMRIYERYLARQIYLTFALVQFAFIGLQCFFDLIAELKMVGHGNYRFSYALLRVLLLAPSHFYEIVPVAVLISATFVFSTLAVNSEYTIFRVSGLSIRRALQTLLKIGLPIVLITFLFGEVISPYAGQFSERLRLKALGASVSSNFQSGVWVKDTLTNDQAGHAVTRFINIGKLNPDNSVENIRIYEFDPDFRLKEIRQARHGIFEAPDYWRLQDVTTTQLQNNVSNTLSPATALSQIYRATQSHQPEYRMQSQLTPQILSVLLVTPERMSIYGLFNYIRHLRQNHQNAQRYWVALWHKCIYPFVVFVMLVLSLPFAYLHTRTGTVSIKVFGGIMLGISFMFLNTLFSNIGTLDTWPAPITTTAPSLLYLLLGLLALRWVDRH